MTASAFSLSEESAQKTSSALPAIETLVDPERLACAQELEARAQSRTQKRHVPQQTTRGWILRSLKRGRPGGFRRLIRQWGR